MQIDIKSMNPEELSGLFSELGEKPFRANQTFKWLHSGVKSFEEMTNLPASLRSTLDERCNITAPRLLRKQVSAQDGTIKYLWGLQDDNTVESVLMSYAHGNTICISTQVGCRMGCAFCASTLGGLVRNLSPSEMLDQVIFSGLDAGKRISNIVLMGIGEPLDNFENVIKFLSLVNNPLGLNIGMRHISLSTCGLAESIDKLAVYNLQLTLSVSLHAADDVTRTRLMPVNNRFGLERLLESCDNYFAQTGRRISYEYAMISGVNDSVHNAGTLSERLRGKGSHLNLILLNNVEEREFEPSTTKSIKAFTRILDENNINYTFRRRLGSDIDASCGQLRRNAGNLRTP